MPVLVGIRYDLTAVQGHASSVAAPARGRAHTAATVPPFTGVCWRRSAVVLWRASAPAALSESVTRADGRRVAV